MTIFSVFTIFLIVCVFIAGCSNEEGSSIPPSSIDILANPAPNPSNNSSATFDNIQIFQKDHIWNITNVFDVIYPAKTDQMIVATCQWNHANCIYEVGVPVANFTSRVTNRDAPLIFQFNDTSMGTPTNWSWSFTNITPGNNTEIVFSTEQNPQLTLEAGNWNIKFTATKFTGSYISSLFANVSYNSAFRRNLTGITFFPPDYVWNVPIDTLPVHANSSEFIANNNGTSGFLITQFGYGTNGTGAVGNGDPYDVVDDTIPKYTIFFQHPSTSINISYPIPSPLPGIGGTIYPEDCTSGDCRSILIDRDNHTSYEIYYLTAQYPNGSWLAYSSGVWDLNDYSLVGKGYSNAAGVPSIAGMVRYDEIEAGSINHSLSIGLPSTRYGCWSWPARTWSAVPENAGTGFPRFGERFRLKSSYNISGFSQTNQIILTAMKKYGMIVSDNSPLTPLLPDGNPTSWKLNGIRDKRWNWTDLFALTVINGGDFEAIDESGLMINADSGQVNMTVLGIYQTELQPVANFTSNVTSDTTSLGLVYLE